MVNMEKKSAIIHVNYLESGNIIEFVTFNQLMDKFSMLLVVFIFGLSTQILVLLRYLRGKTNI